MKLYIWGERGEEEIIYLRLIKKEILKTYKGYFFKIFSLIFSDKATKIKAYLHFFLLTHSSFHRKDRLIPESKVPR